VAFCLEQYYHALLGKMPHFDLLIASCFLSYLIPIATLHQYFCSIGSGLIKVLSGLNYNCIKRPRCLRFIVSQFLLSMKYFGIVQTLDTVCFLPTGVAYPLGTRRPPFVETSPFPTPRASSTPMHAYARKQHALKAVKHRASTQLKEPTTNRKSSCLRI
jgi:hypothetical protein